MSAISQIFVEPIRSVLTLLDLISALLMQDARNLVLILWILMNVKLGLPLAQKMLTVRILKDLLNALVERISLVTELHA